MSTQVLPTVSRQMDDREIGTSDDLLSDDEEDEDEVELCGANLTSKPGKCERPADECPYHGDEEDDDAEA